MSRVCTFCHGEIPDFAHTCHHCGKDLKTGLVSAASLTPTVHAPALPAAGVMPIARVSVVDVNMPFASMVGFMVKWALAAIPALLLLAVIGFLVAAALSGVAASLH